MKRYAEENRENDKSYFASAREGFFSSLERVFPDLGEQG
jgi:hypothetical protein